MKGNYMLSSVRANCDSRWKQRGGKRGEMPTPQIGPGSAKRPAGSVGNGPRSSK